MTRATDHVIVMEHITPLGQLFTYEGDDITIEEMPQGCIIMSNNDVHQSVVIASTKDALAVMESLAKMISIQMEESE